MMKTVGHRRIEDGSIGMLQRTMADLGLRVLEYSGPALKCELGAEWETRCEGCGLKLIYCTADQAPDRSACFCTDCVAKSVSKL